MRCMKRCEKFDAAAEVMKSYPVDFAAIPTVGSYMHRKATPATG